MSVHSNSRDTKNTDPAALPATPPSLPLYLSVLVVVQCGLLAVGLILNDAGFSNLTMGLATIGITVSYISRKQNVAPKSIEIPALLLCIFLAFVAYFSDRLLPFLAPSDIADNRAKGLAVMLTWLLVFWSFSLTMDAAILFCCVPVVAMFGLVGHMTTEPALVLYFSAFIGASAFMLVHENFLNRRRRTPRGYRIGSEQYLLAGQLQIAAICGIGALATAKLVQPVLEGFGSQFAISSALMQQPQRGADRTITPPTQFNEQRSIEVGLASPSDKVVMQVKAPVGANWRGATFNEYTGRGWRSSLVNPRQLVAQPPRPGAEDVLNDQSSGLPVFSVPVSTITKTGKAVQLVKQEVQLLTSGSFAEVYAAPECRVVRSGEQNITVDMDGTIHFGRSIQGAQYLVESEVVDSSPEILRHASRSVPPEIRNKYTGSGMDNHPDARERITKAAQDAVAGKSTEYDKVMALQDFVAQKCKYSLTAASVPGGGDVTDYFLFTAHAGDCNSFATALAVLCRAVGIPSRVASGFLPGVLEPASQSWFVREKDKHLWTEVYFADVGWAPFDVTAVAEVSDAGESDKALGHGKGLIGFLFQRGVLPPLALLMFVLMLVYVLKVELLDRKQMKNRAGLMLGIPATNLAIIEAYEGACKMIGRRGMPRSLSATPLEYCFMVNDKSSSSRTVSAPLEVLTNQLIRFRYGRETATEDDVKSVHNTVTELKAALKSAKRLNADTATSAPAEA